MVYNGTCCSYAPNNGIGGANYDAYGSDRTIPRAMTAFTAIAWYNAVEILVLIFFVFKRYSGLYFWSLLITTLAVIPYATAAWVKQNNVSHNHTVFDTLLTLGWVIMVPGQSLVLYSRLHLICQNTKLLRFILWMIIVNAVLLCVPTATLNLRQYTKHPEPYVRGYIVMEKIQVTIFTAQELFISGVYLWEIRRILSYIYCDAKTKKSMWQLISMNTILIVLDIALITTEYLNLYMIQTTFKSLVYSIKLKVEFGVLSQIVRVIQSRNEHNNSLTLVFPSSEGDTSVGGPKDSEIRILQKNLPPEWRMSLGNGAGSLARSPDLLEIHRSSGRESRSNSLGGSLRSLEKMYPGRLG